MSKNFRFAFHGPNSLSVVLRKGLKAYAVGSAPNGAVMSVQLFVADESVVIVRSVQTTLNVGEWEEIDTLEFKHLSAPERVLAVLPLPEAWLEIRCTEKLIFATDGFSAECGISLSNQIGDELIIAAGAFPGALALRAPFLNTEFEPQYDVLACRREDLSI